MGLWREFLDKGEIPGAYWALLTHPSSDETVAKKAFGDVHMLSHFVGASNRADIRRLRQLEEENNALVERMERQGRRLRESLSGRDRKIAELAAELADVRANRTAADAMIAKTGDPAESDSTAGLSNSKSTLLMLLSSRGA